MKYCPACGAENHDTAKFCATCGTSFVDAESVESSEKSATTPVSAASSTVNKQGTKSSGNSWIGVIIGVIIVGIVLIVGGHHFYLNHRSEQATADIGQTIANKEFGNDEVLVYYSKSDNAFTIRTKSGSTMRSTLSEYVADGDNQDEVDDITTAYQHFINDVQDKMGSKYKSYYTSILNPWDSSRVYWDSTGTNLTYSFPDDH